MSEKKKRVLRELSGLELEMNVVKHIMKQLERLPPAASLRVINYVRDAGLSVENQAARGRATLPHVQPRLTTEATLPYVQPIAGLFP